MNVADQELINRVKRGEAGAFDALFSRHVTWVTNFVLRLVGDPELAAELTGDVFINVWKYRGSYAGNDFKSWLFAITRNVISSRDRGKRKRRAMQSVEVQIDETVQEEIDLKLREQAESAYRADGGSARHLLVREQVGRLPPKAREALILRVFGRSSYREIAALQNCTVEAARSRVYRSRVRVRAAVFAWRKMPK